MGNEKQKQRGILFLLELTAIVLTFLTAIFIVYTEGYNFLIGKSLTPALTIIFLTIFVLLFALITLVIYLIINFNRLKKESESDLKLFFFD
jgi:hypothetical protein